MSEEKSGNPYYSALRRIIGARRSGMSDDYVAAVCREAAQIKEKWGPWPR